MNANTVVAIGQTLEGERIHFTVVWSYRRSSKNNTYRTNTMMIPRLSNLLFSSLFFMASSALAATEELTVYYNGYEGIQQDPENCYTEDSFPCTITVVDLPLYLDEFLLEQTDGYTMDSICEKQDATTYDCSFTIKLLTETISFEGPLNVGDSDPDVFDLTDEEGTATLVLLSEDDGLVGKFDIVRGVPNDSAAAFVGTKWLSSMLLVALVFLM